MRNTIISFIALLVVIGQCNDAQDSSTSSSTHSDGSVTSYVFSPTLGMQSWKMLSWQGSVKSESTALAAADYASTEKTSEQVDKFTKEVSKHQFVIATRLSEWGGFSMQHAANKEVFNTYRFSVFVPEDEACDFSFRVHIKEDGLLSHADYLNVPRGSWQQFAYRSEIVPTQLEFQKLDRVKCNVYFTDLALIGDGTFRDADSEEESGASLRCVSGLLVLLLFVVNALL